MGKQILIVDDSAIGRRRTREVIESAGFETHAVTTGFEGIAACEQHTFSLILTDFNMPGMTGLGMVKSIRKLPGYAKVPVFMVTTECDKVLISKGQAAGVKLWVLKPFNPEKLLEAVSREMNA